MNTASYKIKVSELQVGDIFSFGGNVWDGQYKFENIQYYNDLEQRWEKEFIDGFRICFWLSYIHGDGKWNGMFKWSDGNDINQLVFIHKYPLSEHKKTKGLPCIPYGGERRIFQYKLNEINISTEYCKGNIY